MLLPLRLGLPISCPGPWQRRARRAQHRPIRIHAADFRDLLLQLADSLKKSLTLTASEVWTGAAGSLERTVSGR